MKTIAEVFSVKAVDAAYVATDARVVFDDWYLPAEGENRCAMCAATALMVAECGWSSWEAIPDEEGVAAMLEVPYEGLRGFLQGFEGFRLSFGRHGASLVNARDAAEYALGHAQGAILRAHYQRRAS